MRLRCRGCWSRCFCFRLITAFPPYPLPRPFWSQASDHYFYVMYSFVVMGAATVYEWDLLFPDLLDIFVLSSLPIAKERLFFGRVLALGIFLALVLGGDECSGDDFFPAGCGAAQSFSASSGACAGGDDERDVCGAGFLALQGVLLNLVGERCFRRITPVAAGRVDYGAACDSAAESHSSASLAALIELGQSCGAVLSSVLVSRGL